MKFKCDNCGGIMFEISHKNNQFSITNPMSMLIETKGLRWTSDPIDEEYYAICCGCSKEWMAGSLDKLKNIMAEARVLK